MRDGDENIFGFLRSLFPIPVQEKPDSTVGAWGVSAEVWFSPGKWGAGCVGTLKASFLPLTDVSSLAGVSYGTQHTNCSPPLSPRAGCLWGRGQGRHRPDLWLFAVPDPKDSLLTDSSPRSSGARATGGGGCAVTKASSPPPAPRHTPPALRLGEPRGCSVFG